MILRTPVGDVISEFFFEIKNPVIPVNPGSGDNTDISVPSARVSLISHHETYGCVGSDNYSATTKFG